ncbi:MAG TPA: hypothetical protein VKT27_16385 [Candidatus Binataceae bacterium]|nr:hypothetical protein [Candidatus Binataceae bacterium]
METDIERIRDELEDARRSLNRTVSEVNRKFESVGTRLQPEYLVEHHPLLSTCIAGALGFASGSRSFDPVAIAVLGGLLGAALSDAANGGPRRYDSRPGPA